MLNVKRILGILIVVSLVALGVVVSRHLIQPDIEQLVELLPKDIDLALQDLHYTQNEDGQRRWTLDADRAEYLKENSTARLEVVSLVYYETRSFGDVHLKADRGELDQDSRELDVWGDVVLTTDRQEQFFTDRLHYNDQQRRLSTESKIRAVTPRLELTGTGLQVDVDSGYLIVKKNVRALIRPKVDKKAEK
jgi:lipopolysaccharide export system protein LptC